MLGMLWYALPKAAMRLGLLRTGDWRGIALMALGLAAFQTVLDDGNVYNWFGLAIHRQIEPGRGGRARRLCRH